MPTLRVTMELTATVVTVSIPTKHIALARDEWPGTVRTPPSPEHVPAGDRGTPERRKGTSRSAAVRAAVPEAAGAV